VILADNVLPRIEKLTGKSMAALNAQTGRSGPRSR
jgi:hypothetical protein